MAGDEMLRHTELTSHTTHLVLEQPLQRLTELQAHLLRQSTHVVVALDDLACNIQALNTVGIDGPLCQPLSISNLLRLSIEHLDKITADNLTFLLRFHNSCKVGKELLTGINTNNVETQHLVIIHYLMELVLPKHAVINKDTGKAVADSPIEQYGSDGGVDTA